MPGTEFLSLTIADIENPIADLSATADDGFVRHRTKTNTTIQVQTELVRERASPTYGLTTCFTLSRPAF